jgi:3-oxoadipate enol-lactonase
MIDDGLEQLVDTDQGQISAVTYGWTSGSDAIPIVLLHSLGTSSRLWDRTIPGLRAAGHSVITLDFLGHGRSEDPQWMPSIIDHADRVEDVLGELGVGAYHLAGTSLGGILGIELGSRPDCRASSIVINGSPGWHTESQRMARLRGLSERLGPSGLPTENSSPGGTVVATDDVERKARVDDLMRCGQWFLNTMWAISSYELHARLPKIATRSLVLMGDGDFHMATSYVLQEGIRGSKLRVISGAGHLTPYDAPEEVGRHITDFIALT